MTKTLILDAMGVLYKAGDDVAELLIPFVIAHDGDNDIHRIERAYMRASSGEITAEEFWLDVGVDPRLEDEYLDGHCLSDGLLDFLVDANATYGNIICLSNDVSEWSAKLRRRFGLERYISGWFISGDMHIRKPALGIYQQLISATGINTSEMIFVDDRAKNLQPAQSLGISCILFAPSAYVTQGGFPVARTLHDIIAVPS